jgi:hypothetical protein
MIPNRETITIFLMLFIVAAGYLYVSDDDYHKKFDKLQVISYNCDKVVGGQYSDLPNEVYQLCGDETRRNTIVKIYKE